MKKLALVLLFAAFSSALLVGCSALLSRFRDKPNVILILVDTLRADKLGVYGNNDGLTPVIDALAKDSVVFKNCYAPSSWTVPSVVSMFTGVWPAQHGVEFAVIERHKVLSQQKLNSGYPTLAEQLKWAGYTNHAAVTNIHINKHFGYGQGFSTFETKSWARATWITNYVKKNLETITGQPPYFLYLHYFDPHDPYQMHKGFEMGLDKKYSTPYLFEMNTAGMDQIRNNPDMKEGSNDFEVIKTLYNGEVKYSDMEIGRLLDVLGVTDKDMIIITSDHGEGFLEHGNLGHGNSVYWELLRVPLIIRFPGKKMAGQQVDDLVSLVDLLPTICTAVGIKAKGELDGFDLVSGLNTKVFPDRPLYVDLNRPEVKKNALVFRNWKFHLDQNTGEKELFDLVKDPGETKNIADQHEKVVSRLTDTIKDHLAIPKRFPAPIIHGENVNEEDLDKLKSMGYLN